MLHIDKNPYFDKDDTFTAAAKKAVDVLWEATGGDFSSVPESYLSSLDHSYSDGTVSILSQLSKVDFAEGITYEDYIEVVKSLIKTNPNEWPNSESTEEIQSSKLLHQIEPDADFAEDEFDFDFAEDDDGLSGKMELFFKKVISSVYLDGVTNITDRNGNPPNAANNYLMAEDGKSFAGIFYDSPPDATSKKFPFKISEKSEGKWQIRY